MLIQVSSACQKNFRLFLLQGVCNSQSLAILKIRYVVENFTEKIGVFEELLF